MDFAAEEENPEGVSQLVSEEIGAEGLPEGEKKSEVGGAADEEKDDAPPEIARVNYLMDCGIRDSKACGEEKETDEKVCWFPQDSHFSL